VGLQDISFVVALLVPVAMVSSLVVVMAAQMVRVSFYLKIHIYFLYYIYSYQGWPRNTSGGNS
jgi:hypothetical protein